jgi:transglutaminase-like putative cysteine protease
VPSVLTEISSLARAIASGAASDEERIARLVAWMDVNIAKEAVDAFSAADVLRARRGECQGHSYLFAAFARALGLPTRVVNGIAYSEEHGGFLYHTWNEVWIAGRGWQPVDATFGQAHADATHVKLIEGETAAELLPLVNLVGRVRVASVSALARW